MPKSARRRFYWTTTSLGSPPPSPLRHPRERSAHRRCSHTRRAGREPRSRFCQPIARRRGFGPKSSITPIRRRVNSGLCKVNGARCRSRRPRKRVRQARDCTDCREMNLTAYRSSLHKANRTTSKKKATTTPNPSTRSLNSSEVRANSSWPTTQVTAHARKVTLDRGRMRQNPKAVAPADSPWTSAI